MVASSDSTAEKGSNTTPEMVLASWADAAGGVSVVRDSRRGEDALEVVVASFKLVRCEKFERYASISLSLPQRDWLTDDCSTQVCVCV